MRCPGRLSAGPQGAGELLGDGGLASASIHSPPFVLKAAIFFFFFLPSRKLLFIFIFILFYYYFFIVVGFVIH